MESPEAEMPSPTHSELTDSKESELKEMYTHSIISSPESSFTLEHKRQTPKVDSLIYCVRFDPEDSKTLAIGYSDGTIGIYRVSNLEKSNLLAESSLSQERNPVGSFKWRPKTHAKDRLIVSASVDGNICYWNPFSGKLIATLKSEKKFSDLYCVDYSRDGMRLAVAGKRRSVLIYDDEKRVPLSKLRNKGQGVSSGHSNCVSAVRFDETGKILLSASWDMTIKVWDLNTGTVVRSIFGPEITGDALDISGDMILAGSHRSKESIQVFSLDTGKLIENVEWDKEHVGDSSLIFSSLFEKSGNRFFGACGSGRNEARIYEKRADMLYGFSCGVVGLPTACSSMDFSAKDNLIAVGCCDGICRLFERIEKGKRESFLASDF